MAGNVAVIDIGKTNAKLALVRRSDLAEIAVLKRPNTVLQGAPYPHFDVDGHWEFILAGLAAFQADHGVSAISITTHGACAALLAADGRLAAPILDYEHTVPDDLAKEYDAIRPNFAETGSPRLGMGLNIGAQLFWQFAQDQSLKSRVVQIVTYPQYWGHRLTGVAATDVTSLGCHTDLWAPREGGFSSLVARLGLEGKIAPPRKPSDVLGPILPAIAARTGLSPETPVLCGIHDSNASLLPHVLRQDAPFGVVSTGTWVIAMAMGGTQLPLDASRDMLINVNAFGDPVPSARFMGGREHDLALQGHRVAADDATIARVLNSGVMLLPALAPESGIFRGHTARWIGEEPAIGTPERTAAVGLYLALVTARCLQGIGQEGPVIVEGPFGRNRAFLQMLSALRPGPVFTSTGQTGTSEGAALLWGQGVPEQALEPAPTPAPEHEDAFRPYAKAWGDHLT
ncbi:FGGY-family carbohydrate kinase [Pseudoruegeria sp. SHC-113]|uniref:FGGY-family carbohydrate kinase n=1 Tax=Pseudoruegeria sp. SHC-113 TaxID=2855439 RepID=UPI0021BA666C|nr:FGGY-family carbohydrate kinase [Pseudoruegeria sp. SHC-113]MCT8158702.1 FGGY-family carbohydrate kinase [Pseudoruegeria sp. SHC-113]